MKDKLETILDYAWLTVLGSLSSLVETVGATDISFCTYDDGQGGFIAVDLAALIINRLRKN
jgi:hypothetical protein